MAKIKNIEEMTIDDLNRELAVGGGKFVVFEYCISIVVMTFKRGSNIYFIKAGQSTTEYSIGLHYCWAGGVFHLVQSTLLGL